MINQKKLSWVFGGGIEGLKCTEIQGFPYLMVLMLYFQK